MQELLEWVRTTLPMDLDTPMLIEEKIESLLEKEKQHIIEAYGNGYEAGFTSEDFVPEQYYNETFNTNEK